MNRSVYTDEWRRMVDAAIHSPKGQSFLREMAIALDSLPDKWLINGSLVDDDGDCCAIGAVCKARGIDTAGMDNDLGCVAERLGVPLPLACEIVNENDDCRETLETRWQRMRRWVDRHITQETGK